MGWRSGFRRILLKNLQSYAYIVCGNKNVAQRLYTGDISVMGLFIGVTRRGNVKPVNCIHTHTFCSLIQKISEIQE